MIYCRACNSANTDIATVCSSCRTPLNKAVPPAGAPGQQHRQPTIDEKIGVFSTLGVSSRSAGQNQAKAAVPHPVAPPARRVTIFDPSASLGLGFQPEVEAQPKRQATAARKIVGILISYTWSDQGQIFPILEGRNRIGSDPLQCDIVVPQDETLSSINSHIVFRKSFTIGDDVSMSGTDVDGEQVETAFVPLRNYARIRTGSTHWTFIAVQPAIDQKSDAGTEGN